ncbi:hypothetical protein KVR01_013596 [Diaporthe batatas]|uniref:uncharacterized protein n=1 Tax=Diaporthe batatas TaxID=748121 RepID=UPI001D0436CE|nr:uncharacterized protein KVR01_013596 [Diaporthe batatas]KAG8156492.1 hypothetical protein KVR01_013596 [Diaporthe batatas]
MSMVKPDGTLSFKTWAHVDHCIDSVRQQLMCQADIAAFTFDWRAEKILEPMIDTIHVCRNFTKIQEWAENHYVNLTNAMKKLHVEQGEIVNYTGTYNPEEFLVENENTYAPEWWLNLQVKDYFDDNTLSAISKELSRH